MPVQQEATLIDGKAIAAKVRLELKSTLSKYLPRQPGLAIIQVGDRGDSSVYVRMKERAAEEVGIRHYVFRYPVSISESKLLQQIKVLNADPTIHGIIVQLPLPGHLQSNSVTQAVDPEKDVDGLHALNVGHLSKRQMSPSHIPCTPLGVMRLLEASGVALKGRRVAIVGRSDLVGMPLFHLMLRANATPTLCHSQSENLPSILKECDVVVAACGQPQLIQGDWLKRDCVVIDVGTNVISDESAPKGTRLVGDVDAVSCKQVASLLSPVPGGVGPMTVAMLLSNTVTSAIRSWSQVKPMQAIQSPVPFDADIVAACAMVPIVDIAKDLGILPSELRLNGHYKAKLDLSLLKRLNDGVSTKKRGFYVCVSGITPTSLGEGKSTTTIGLCQALGAHCHQRAIACVRQPSQGPTFGIKGGAAGGGYAQIVPMDEFNLHLTGDIHAVTAANNLLAAALDARLFHEATQSDEALFQRLYRADCPVMKERMNRLRMDSISTIEDKRRLCRLDIDPDTITWRRVLDTNDRFLRQCTIGQSPTEQGHSRQTGFDIAVASEIMAILALSTSLADLKERLSRMIVAQQRITGLPITAQDLGITGALAALLRDTLQPTLMQTLEGTPVFVHAGPFANIAHGNSSILADQMALQLADFVVTEAGFGSEMGFEKFMHIKCRTSQLMPDACVLVVTVRALKSHGDNALEKGALNMGHHIRVLTQSYRVPCIVAINRFHSDTEEELVAVQKLAKEAGALDALISDAFSQGGKGAVSVAQRLIQLRDEIKDLSSIPRFLYDLKLPLEDKLNLIVKQVYGGTGVTLSDETKRKLALFTEWGFGELPICMAKTQYSLSHDPNLKGAPTDFVVPVRDLRLSAGAGFIVALLGEIQTMPGLPTRPCFFDMDVNSETGQITGLC